MPSTQSLLYARSLPDPPPLHLPTQTLSLSLHGSAPPTYISLPAKTKSTISLSFSPDGRHILTSHGDHTLKLTSCHQWSDPERSPICTLSGHPRTPWTVKFHPVDSTLAASGCLGHLVKVWRLPPAGEPFCEDSFRVNQSVIGISLHPTKPVLIAGAAGTVTARDYEVKRSRSIAFPHDRQIRACVFSGEHH
ncbi:hypothetical protein TeGR_g2842, partial [Tetraparma gracilis]